MSFLRRLRTLQRPFVCAEGSLSAYKQRYGWSEFDPNAHIIAIKEMHRGFVQSGCDAIKTFAHQNETAFMIDVHKKEIELAFEVKEEFAKMDIFPLIAGGLCNHGMYRQNNPDQDEAIKNQYREQLRLFAEYGVDYVTAEAFEYFGDAELALSAIKEFKLPSVITMNAAMSKDGWQPPESCDVLKRLGADMVGIDCDRNPIDATIPILSHVKDHLGDDNELGIAVTSVYAQEDNEINELVKYCKELKLSYVSFAVMI